MTTLLHPPPNDSFSRNPNGFSTLDKPSQLWLYRLRVSQDSKNSLFQSLRDQQGRNKEDSRPSDKSEAHVSFTRKSRRSSRVYISRDDVSSQRARYLERNRVAANKFRKKKKKEHQQLQSALHVETAKREILLAQVNVLKEELLELKNRMFEHADCADQKINIRLAMMTQNLLGANIEPLDCPSLTSSASTRSDRLVKDGTEEWDTARIHSGPLKDIADPVPDLQDALFETFIDMPSTEQ